MDNSVISRYESKYMVPDSTAIAIREYIRGICSPDRYADENGLYTVNNLYFDTPDLRFYYDTKFCRYDRFKPRVRFYGKRPQGLLWLELKHKIKNVTWKTRRALPLEQWDTLFSCSSVPGGQRRMVDIRSSFEDAVICFGASPVLHVRYLREPWVSDLEQYCRITFDRHLTCRMAHGSYDLGRRDDFLYYDDAVNTVHCDDHSPTLIEIKTEINIPGWVQGLIQHFDLQRRGFSKYCNAIDCQTSRAPFECRARALA